MSRRPGSVQQFCKLLASITSIGGTTLGGWRRTCEIKSSGSGPAKRGGWITFSCTHDCRSAFSGSGNLDRVAPVHISAYNPQWPERASVLIAELRDVLGPDALRIEHIGSTAIPLMDAKDLLDVQVSVADLGIATEHFDRPLSALGFERLPYDSDHVPAGRLDDPARWVKRFWCRRNHLAGDVNLHVRAAGSPNERLALLFRDWMRAHPEAVPPYAAFKRALGTAAPDVDWYTDLKDPVVDLVVAIAESWSQRTGWTVQRSTA
jgi:GrpB-like predicted nucleotidyltransferase (UPF0157 family)